jgi:hypothetical protein
MREMRNLTDLISLEGVTVGGWGLRGGTFGPSSGTRFTPFPSSARRQNQHCCMEIGIQSNGVLHIGHVRFPRESQLPAHRSWNLCV